MNTVEPSVRTEQSAREKIAPALQELGKVIIGQKNIAERLFVALLCDGHVLLEGAPGLAKTTMLHALSTVLQGQMKRVQFTPDLLPSDIIGGEIFRPQSASFAVRQGPVFCNFLLADEINRAPAKVQSALLQAMQEREVTIGDTVFPLPSPFLVMATQNPLEQEGTYPLPEAQLDRFLFKLLVDYPSAGEEEQIVRRNLSGDKISLQAILSLGDIQELRSLIAKVPLHDALVRYAVLLVQTTRTPKSVGLERSIRVGASPRASIALCRAAQCLAVLEGKQFVTPDQVKNVAKDVLRHRIILTLEAQAQGITADQVLTQLLAKVPLPS